MDINPYQSPVFCGPHQNKMPIWLKRFLGACAVIGAVVLTSDSVYMHRLQSRSGRFNQDTYRAMIEQWIIDEWYGGPQPRR